MRDAGTFGANAHLVLCIVLEETLDTTTGKLNVVCCQPGVIEVMVYPVDDP